MSQNRFEPEYGKKDYYLLPKLSVPESPDIGKFGRMRMQYLKGHRRGVYTAMLLKGTLNAHLEEIDLQAEAMMDRLIEQMARAEGVTEQLKAEDQLEWVRRMNSIQNRAEDIVMNEQICN